MRARSPALDLARYALVALAVLTLLAAGCRGKKPAEPAQAQEERATPVEVILATRGTIAETIEVTGTVQALHEVSVGSSMSEKITYLSGDEGDPVRAGQVVALLDCADLDASIHQAQTQVEGAKIRLAQAREGHTYKDISTQKGIETARTQIDAARTRLSQAQTGRDLLAQQVDDGIAAARTRVEQARAQLEQARSGLGQTEESTQAGVRSARAAVESANAAYADLKRGARTQEREQAQERVHQAELQVDNVRRDLQRMRTLKEAGAVSQQTVDGLQLQYDTAVSQFQMAQQALSLIREGPTREQLTIAEQQIEQAKAGLATAEASRAQVEQQRQLVRTAEQSVTAAEIGLTDAENQRLSVKNAEADIEAATHALRTTEIAYEQAQAGEITVSVDEKEVAAAENAVKTAQALIGLYAAQKHKRTIVSPVAGTISKKHSDVGEICGMGGPILTIVTENALEFEATVSELDVSRVLPGDTVDVAVDGVPSAKIVGHIVSILPAGDVASRNFTIKISVPGDVAVKPGMFARGQVRVKYAEDVVAVPRDVLLEHDGSFFAYVVQDGRAVRRDVVLGLEGIGVVEIISGIEAGEQVVIHGKEALSDGATVEAQLLEEADRGPSSATQAEATPESA